jgi:hypothetical protein
MLSRIAELLERLRKGTVRLRGQRPRMPDLRGKIEDARYGWEERREVFPRLFPNVRRTGGRLLAADGLLGDARERLRPWHAVPALIALIALLAGGFWLGGIVGGHASAAVLTKTLKIKGQIITVNGKRYVSTPAVTVKVKGKIVHIPAKTVRLPASTVISGKTVPVKVDVNHTVSVPLTISVPTTRTQTQTSTTTTTINHTVVTTVIHTTTQTQTVTGPTTTSIVTITLPATTVTVTVTTT